MIILRTVVLVLIGILSGCASKGITFSNTTIAEDQVLPPEVTTSISASIYRHDLNTLTGQLAVVDGKGAITPVLRAVDPQKLPIITAIPEENGILYRSIISHEGRSILSAVVTGMSVGANQKAELVIKQITQSILQEVPRSAVLGQANLIATHKDQKLVYITGVVLSLVRTTLLDEVDADAKIDYGPVFGFNGKVYKSSSQLRNDYIITMNTIDVSLLRDPGIRTVNTVSDVAKEITAPAPTAPKPPITTEVSVLIPAQATHVNAPVLPTPQSSVIVPTEYEEKLQHPQELNVGGSKNVNVGGSGNVQIMKQSLPVN